MKLQRFTITMFRCQNICIFILISLLLSCQQREGASGYAGIALSFDDHFISEWYELRPLFQKYNARATFFITCPDSLRAEEIMMLRQLQEEGHEIGFHGTIHGKSTELITLGAGKYAEAEIDPGMAYLAAAGFKPTSYAHPGGNHNNIVDSVLMAHGFRILRDVAISRRTFRGLPLYTLAPRIMNWIFYRFDQEALVDGLLIDRESGITNEEIRDAIERAKKTNTALMLFGHKPLYSPPVNGEYGFDVSFLETILKEVYKQGLKFYTMTELVDTDMNVHASMLK